MLTKQVIFPRSDGSSERWPTHKLDDTPNEQGEINFMKYLDHDDPSNIKWRSQTGREVAKLLGNPGKY